MGKALGMTEEDVKALIQSGEHALGPDTWIESTLTHSILLGHQLAAKVAIGAGVLADGSFAHTDLAAALRRVLWAEAQVGTSVSGTALVAVLQMIQRSLPPTARPLEPLGVAPDAASSPVVFMPIGCSRTAVFSYILGFLVSIEGMVIDARSPLGDLPVVVVDGSPCVVRRLADDLRH